MAISARLIATQSFDMSTWDITNLSGATFNSNDGSRATYTAGSTLYVFGGSGLTTDGGGHATGGTVNDFTIWDTSGATPVSELVIKGLFYNFTDFDAYVQANDAAGLFTSLFSDDNTFIGSSGNDVLSGYDGNDTFNLTQGGNDTVDGGIGHDVFSFGTAFDSSDQVDGGDGNDVIKLNGPTNITLDSDSIFNVETFKLKPGSSYSLTLDNANVAAGHVLTINGSALGTGDVLTVDASAIADGSVKVLGGADNDAFTGGPGVATFFGSGGDDTVSMLGNFTAADHIDGGDGYDILNLEGDYSAGVTLTAHTLANVEEVDLAPGFSYKLILSDAATAPGEILTVDGSFNLASAGDSVYLDGSQESDGDLNLYGGFGNDTLIGGRGDDYLIGYEGDDTIYGGRGNDYIDGGEGNTSYLDGGAGNDTLIGCDAVDTIIGGKGNDEIIGEEQADILDGGAGHDLYFYSGPADSTSTQYDTIIGFDALNDGFFPTDFVTTFHNVEGGALSTATFDADLEAAVGAASLEVQGAALYHPDSGDQAGKYFVLIDDNGTAGYQAGQDLVIYLSAPANIASFGLNDFF